MKQFKLLLVLSLSFLLFLFSCGKKTETPIDTQETPIDTQSKSVYRAKFSGNYNREFNDLHDLHMTEALKNGITPLKTRDDTLKQLDKLVRLPDKLPLYKQYKITHSIPYLVPSAAKLFIDIAQNFRDSLYSKEMPIYKLYLTSITRTEEDVRKLTKRNINASENSTHMYGTTFDISWKRFEKIDLHRPEDISPDKLKLVLAEVLFDLKQNGRCYIKHERRQACFHITVRS